ncbi:MAG TPA: C39 family peptidase [Hyalangium sp.]|nr:C39 family peptidase [Hyalangium sp.]
MHSIGNTTQRNACFPNDPEGAASQATTSYTLQKGDTLSKLAQGLQRQGLVGTVAEILKQILTLNPQIRDQNRIAAGSTLQLPATPGQTAPPQQESRANSVEAFSGRAPMMSASQLVCSPQPVGQTLTAGQLALCGTVAAPASSFLRDNGVPFPTSWDGTPRYMQGDSEWGGRRLGDSAPQSRTVSQKGCAMTSVAMALSKLSGETITPKVLDAFLDKKNGYSENAIVWGVAGKVTKQPITLEKSTTWNLDTINAELAAGRPVVIGVDYKAGSSGGNLGTDHWVCLTQREPGPPELYLANDPATGEEIRFLRQPNGTLLEEKVNGERTKKCRSTGEFVTFSKPAKS